MRGSPVWSSVIVFLGGLTDIYQLDSSTLDVGNQLTFLVVGPAGSGVDESASDSGNEESVGDSELDGVVEGSLGLGQHGI
jgi:hypothetical protein